MKVLKQTEIQAVSGGAAPNSIQTLGLLLVSPFAAAILQQQNNTYGFGPDISYFKALGDFVKYAFTGEF